MFPRDNIIGFFLEETGLAGWLVFALILAAAGLHGGLIVGIALSLDRLGADGSLARGIGLLGGVLLYVALDHTAFRLVSLLSEKAIARVTLRLVSASRGLDLLDLESIGAHRLIDLAARDFAVVSALQRDTFVAAGNIVMAGVMLVTLLVIAPLIALLLVGVAVWTVRTPEVRRIVAREREAAASERRFLGLIRAAIAGFAELKLDRRKWADMHDTALRPAARGIVEPRVATRRTIHRFDAVQGAAITIIAAVAAFGARGLGFGGAAVAATFIALYLGNALGEVVFGAADMLSGSEAVRNLRGLEAEIVARIPLAREAPAAPRRRFAALRLEAAVFLYPGDGRDSAGGAGPVDLEIRPGEILFLTGGNGSGKSTLLKMLTGLYPLSAGRLVLDGRRVDGPAVRGMVTGVFTDFHLFTRLYGTTGVSQQRVDALLERLGLTGKTRFVDGAFTTTALSSGQRKRLALVVATLEDRPIYVFDEWAADQDPAFRAFFYSELLPDLRAAGKAVVVATHDDRYFHLCDQLIVLEAGRVVQTAKEPA